MAKILVTGAKGQLGQSIAKLASDYAQYQLSYVDVAELDLSSKDAIEQYFADKCFDVIINCAAYTAVDKAESEPELADAVNHQAVATLAQLAKQRDMTLIHISTDYVFDGRNHRPYTETDCVAPHSVYGDTKLKGELALLKAQPRGCIIRTSWVYSEFGNNFVKTMLRLGAERDELGVIFDQIGSPTYAEDLARAILTMIAKMDENAMQVPEIYHFSNEGVCSWYDFAKAIFELADIDCEVRAIETKDYPTPAKRPHYSLMNKSKIKHDFELPIPYWRDSLVKCLKQLQAV